MKHFLRIFSVLCLCVSGLYLYSEASTGGTMKDSGTGDNLTLSEQTIQNNDPIKAGGVLVGGEMTDSTKWQISILNTDSANAPTVTWGDTTNTPSAGQGGALYMEAVANNSAVQYAIYQQVSLSKDSVYTFNAAFKDFSPQPLAECWVEVFMGPAPKAGEDYGGGTPGATQIAGLSAWVPSCHPGGMDGTFAETSCNDNIYVSPVDTDTFLVFKMGGMRWDGQDRAINFAIDELSLTAQRTKPFPAFTADSQSGFAPLTVQFKNESSFATSWSWDFGDGSEASTEQNPTHRYLKAGTYTVTLKTTNELGDSVLTKEDYITVNPPIKLVGGGILKGGNMEDSTKWMTSILNTDSANAAAVTWGDTANTPSAGQGGALYMEAVANNSAVQYAIYQQVSLSKDSVYTFNAAFKDFSPPPLAECWVEVFMGPAPKDGEDYGGNTPGATQFAGLSAWVASCHPGGMDGTFAQTSCNDNTFITMTDADTFFVLKMGGMRWDGQDRIINFAIDEISLTAKRTKPYPAFSAENQLGFPPLTVKFKDESYFATSWSWDFGDGSEASTEQHPTHEYTVAGTYTVTLTATNEMGDTTLTKSELVKVNPKPELPEGEKLYGGNMEDPNLWNITKLNANGVSNGEWNNTADTLMYGEGGNLKITATAKNSTAHYAIWQAIELTEGKTYTFTAAFRDLTDNLDHFWSEVFISTNQPVDNEDYAKDAEGTVMIAHFNTWECGKAPGLDGTYQDNACGDAPVGVFVPDSTYTYYFVIKTGNTDWENTDYSFTVLIDEVSLMESNPPTADFFADVTEGDSPLVVNFTDLSENVDGWEWHFGDDSTSVEQNPSHTYAKSGTYTVTLIAFNGSETDTLVVKDLIVVSPGTGLDEIQLNQLRVYPNPSQGRILVEYPGLSGGDISVFDITGRLLDIQAKTTSGAIELNINDQGLYLIGIKIEDQTIMKKIIVQ